MLFAGQFWNIPVTFAKFTGAIPSDLMEEEYYNVTVLPWNESSPPRSFLGRFYPQEWDHSEGPCLYVGNIQGGPSLESEVKLNDSVIEGSYLDYLIPGGDIFETEYKFSQFNEERCSME